MAAAHERAADGAMPPDKASPDRSVSFESVEIGPASQVSRVRLDKWLWAARFFKTRSMAGRACELGRVAANGQAAKPAREVHVGDLLQVKNESGDFEIEVVQLSDLRGPAPVAQKLYRETEASREARMKAAEERKAMPRFEAPRMGRPSKRDRREMNRFRGRG